MEHFIFSEIVRADLKSLSCVLNHFMQVQVTSGNTFNAVSQTQHQDSFKEYATL